MELNRLSLKDSEIFNEFLAIGRHELSVYAFENIYIWKALFDIRWSVIEKCLCIFFVDRTGCFLYLPPLSKRNNPGVIQKAFGIMDSFNKNKDISRIENIEERELVFYKDSGYSCANKSCDYLCARQALADLSGNGFKSKRASFNYFTGHYTFEYMNFSPRQKKECLKLYSSWAAQRKAGNDDPVYQGMIEDSSKSLKITLDSYADLNLTGKVVKIDKKIKGFSLGFKLNSDTFCILYEITDLSIKGLAQFIFRKFCADLKDFKYINIMDDSGLDNLKEVKLSYRPLKLIPAYIAKR
ncbi:MAG: phosphatidylglycerol lysyltransferase domain-containing protein [Candidatus Omnitrophica bacterium]|nr:phosphatidylglycerol lysyltransferase domain-containing protein [Candidatus Omnitrophota bacterium]MDD5552437.1 phosphatidylglycerol lysyltransferase domain-containing protein [Candidatus Omnitrophota bacterium]